jgi:hypothetical protein
LTFFLIVGLGFLSEKIFSIFWEWRFVDQRPPHRLLRRRSHDCVGEQKIRLACFSRLIQFLREPMKAANEKVAYNF